MGGCTRGAARPMTQCSRLSRRISWAMNQAVPVLVRLPEPCLLCLLDASGDIGVPVDTGRRSGCGGRFVFTL